MTWHRLAVYQRRLHLAQLVNTAESNYPGLPV